MIEEALLVSLSPSLYDERRAAEVGIWEAVMGPRGSWDRAAGRITQTHERL